MAASNDSPEGRSAYSFDQAIQHYLKGDSTNAIKLLNESLQILPTNKRARVFLLKILVERGSRLFLAKKFKKAHQFLSQAYHMDPENKQVRQMFELATKQINPQQPTNNVMLIPKGMKQEMLKQEAEEATRAQGGTVMTSVKTKTGEVKRVVAQNQYRYTQPAPQQVNRAGSSQLMAEYAKNVSAMTNLMATFTKSQEAQMSQFMAPLERIQNLYYESEADRKKFMNRLDGQFKSVLGDVSFQQRMVIYGFIIGLILLGVLSYIFFLIVKRMRSKREETIMKYQQEMLKMVRDMAGLPGTNTYGMLGSGGMANAGYRLNPGMQQPQQQLMAGQAMPGQMPMAGQPMPGQAMPGQMPMAGQPMPGQPMPGQPMPGQMPMAGQPMAGQPMADQPTADQTVPNQESTESQVVDDGQIIPDQQQPVDATAYTAQTQIGFEIEQMIQTGNYKERSLAAMQLMDVDAEKALDYIKQMITDTDPFQRESIIFALGERYHPLTLELVIEGLKDNEKRVVDASVRSLKRLEQSPDDSMTEQIRQELKSALSSVSGKKKARKKSARSKQS